MKKLFGPFLYTPTTSIKYISFIFCVNISIFPVFCFQYILYTNVLIMHFKFEASFTVYYYYCFLLSIIGIFEMEYIYSPNITKIELISIKVFMFVFMFMILNIKLYFAMVVTDIQLSYEQSICGKHLLLSCHLTYYPKRICKNGHNVIS